MRLFILQLQLILNVVDIRGLKVRYCSIADLIGE